MKNYTLKLSHQRADKSSNRFLLLIITALTFLASQKYLLHALENSNTKRKDIRCVLHLHSREYNPAILEGTNTIPLSMEEVVLKARSEKIDALIITDLLSGRINIKPFPQINILSLGKDFPSILTKLPEKYLIEIARLNKKYQDIIIIPGTEISSDHWWKIPPSLHSLLANTRTFYLMGWHRHLIAAGLYEPQDYYDMPVSGGVYTGQKIDPLMFWPIIILVIGIGIMRKRPTRGILIFVIGIILLGGNYPFAKSTAGRISTREEYTTDSLNGIENFQNVINHTIQQGGIIFWAHPEAKNSTTYQFKNLKVVTNTEPYPELLERTNNYTGFAIFAEGYRKCGNTSGIWDKLLVEYCNGTRTNPVWAVSEADFGGDNSDGSLPLAALQNILWFEQNEKITPKSIIEKLKNGNFYALWQSAKTKIFIKDFFITSTSKNNIPQKAIFGETLELTDEDNGEIKISLELKTDDSKILPAKIFLIANGKTRLEFQTTIPCKIIHALKPTEIMDKNTTKKINTTNLNKQVKGYIRFFIDAGYPNYIATNPVFYIRKNSENISN